MKPNVRHLEKIHKIRLALSAGHKTSKEISKATGIHPITVSERLHEAQVWGVVVTNGVGADGGHVYKLSAWDKRK